MDLITVNACRTIRNTAAAFFVLILTACATPQSGSPPTVFGRVVAKRDGNPEKLVTIERAGDGACYALVLFETENRGLMLRFDDDGWFAWTLAPGDYVFSDLWCTSGSKRKMPPVNMHFKVVPLTASIYIGHFRLNYANDRFDPISWEMNEAEATAEFARRYPGAAAPIAQEPVRDRGPGNFATIRSICASQSGLESEWGLKCGADWQGIEAVEPIKRIEPGVPGQDQRPFGAGFATLDTRVPTLKWKPATAAGMTYDVAVWEAVNYHRKPVDVLIDGEITKDIYSPGRLAVYAENIDSPQFEIRDPLKAKTKYFWSVRLRKADRVSTWSRRGFRVPYYSRSGEWFAFETP